MRALTLTLALSLPALAFAAGSDTGTPPSTTKTTTECKNGTVFDADAGKCVKVQDSRLDDDDRFKAAREFAYAGQYRHAQEALAAMSEGMSDRVLTYMGFTARKMGDRDGAMAFYQAALAQNPDNLLARSYKGQAHVDAGEVRLARAELSQIRRRGGRGTWAAFSLRTAISSGQGYAY